MLETSWFELIKHKTKVHERLRDGFYSSREEIKAVYYPELEELIKSRTGAPFALVLGHVAREAVSPAYGNDLSAAYGASVYARTSAQNNNRPGRRFPNGNQYNGAVRNVHTDYVKDHKER